MIADFQFENYRGFPEYSIDGLTRINVFVGCNNAGKTSILEGIYLFTSDAPIKVINSIAARRGEQLVITSEGSTDVKMLPDVRHLFNGHQILPNEVLTIGTKDKRFSFRLTQKVADRHLMTEAALQMLKNRNAVVLSVFQKRYQEQEKEVGVISISPDGEVSEYRKHSPEIDKEHQPSSVFVSTETADYGFLSSLWNGVLSRGDEDSVVKALQILNPGLKSIAFMLFDPRAARAFSTAIPGIVVGMEGYEGQRLPLGSLGDGSRRLLSIALALSEAKNGYLFIDEIDVGLHYSAMTRLWELILTSAHANNVQVFVSTHSLDCLRGLSEAIGARQDLRGSVSLHAVSANQMQATTYTDNEIAVAMRQEIEVR